jgi:hypothetical protein
MEQVPEDKAQVLAEVWDEDVAAAGVQDVV